MAFLNELDNILTVSTGMLLENERLCKLLYYYPDKKNFSFNPESKPKIKNPNELLLTKIYPLPKVPDIETEQICFVNVTVGGGENCTKNAGFRRIYLVFDVICHLDSWIIKGGFRPLKVLAEIDGMFNDQKTNLPIENKPLSKSISSKRYADKFFGYQIAYELMVNSNISCGGKS